MKIGLLPLGRPTFDVEFANQKLSAMLECLANTGHELIGPNELLMDEAATRQAISDLTQSDIDLTLVLQVTFTDASMITVAANQLNVPLAIWAVREPRAGDRLRLNSFCGLNLASHALSLSNTEFSWLLGDPSEAIMGDLAQLIDGARKVVPVTADDVSGSRTEAGKNIVEAIKGKRVARLGEHPVGFDTCAYDADKIKALTGVSVEAFEVDSLFDAATSADPDRTDLVRENAEGAVDGLALVDQDELDKSLRLKVALDDIKKSGKFDAFAIRCWPETFTEYGGAVCGPASMMGEARVPCACEADVYGALTQLILQEVADAPVFLTDLVDIDRADDSAVVWHCGQAPISMRDDATTATATIHTNRKMPLLYQFTLKPGPVTLLRVSQSYGSPKLVLGYAEMLRRPMAFTGTSGVMRFERPVGQVLDDIMGSGLEHHMALAYGDHREMLRSVAAAFGLPLLEI